MYTVEGSYTQRRGNTETIPFNDPTIQQLLTKFRSTGLWEGSFWVDLTYHTAAFRFYSNRTWRLYVDGVQQSSGSYTLVNRYPDTFSVTFTVGDREGTLYETFGYFTMANGPGNSLIQYFYSGD